LAQAGHVGLLV